jgi:hypothetical protein
VFDSSLGTTNLLLAILAAVSVLEAAVLAGVAAAAWKVYGRSIGALSEAQAQIAPLVTRVNDLADKVDALAGDVKDVTAVARKTAHLFGIARGVRAAYQTFVGRDAGYRSTQEG